MFGRNKGVPPSNQNYQNQNTSVPPQMAQQQQMFLMQQQRMRLMQQQQMQQRFLLQQQQPFGQGQRVPLIQPKGYVPKGSAAGPSLENVPTPANMLRSAVHYISPAVYHPGEPGKNLSQNVLSVELGALCRPVDLATGDPVRCKQCQAVFCASDAPSLTKSEKKEGDEDEDMTTRVWTCRYCGCKQEIEIDDAEIPTSNVSEYVVAPGEEPQAAEAASSDAAAAATAAAATAGAADPEDNCYVVFCVDISGSMSMTSLQGGKHVSKLACVANAVYSQMDALRHEHPNRRVCLITFGTDVDVFDGEKHSQAGGVTLSEWDSIVKFAEGVEVEKPVSSVFDALAEQVIYMEERGCTALGPALLTSLTIAGRKRGSYVVLCTDGMANQGIGSLEDLHRHIDQDETKKSDVELLYERFGNHAREAGVTVSVIGIKGAECSLENLGVVADTSGGSVDLADPGNLDFSGAIEEPVLATRVQVSLRVDPAFIFGNGKNALTADVGNVKRLTRQQCALFSSPDDKIKPPSEVRMQCEITYTTKNNAVHLRVLEKVIPFMENLREAVDGIDIELVGGYVARTAASMAHDGEVEAAGEFSQGYQDLLNQYLRMQRRVNTQQQIMMDRFSATNTRAQNLVQGSLMQQRASGWSNSSAARRRSDFESANIYQMRSDQGAASCLIM